jgi:cytochrome P450
MVPQDRFLDIKSPEFRNAPHALYARLRAGAALVPIRGSFVRNAWFAPCYRDVVDLLMDPRLANDARNAGIRHAMSAWWMPRLFATLQSNMLNADEPQHRRLRNLVHRAFTPARVRDMRAAAVTIVERLLDEAARRGEVDLMAAFALPLPLEIISVMMGVPVEDRARFQGWMKSLTDSFSGGLVGVLMQVPTGNKLLRLFEGLIGQRRADPRDDLVSALVQAEEEDGDRLSADDLIAMVFLLLLAGHETTVNLIGAGTLALLEDPEQRAALRARPEGIERAIEELLRFTSPAIYSSPRYAKEDLELHGQRIARGAAIFGGIASANRDAAVFADPEHLDLERDPNKHLALGMGIHYCLGAPLARMEGALAIAALVQRFPAMRLAVPAERLEWRLPGNIRGLKALPLRLA